MAVTTDIPAASDTLSERATLLLRRAILTGEFAPGAKLRIPEITRSLGIGATPVREGLTRLADSGLVTAIGQRGFQVTPMSEDDLKDIIATRTLVEIEAFTLAMQKGDDVWEANIIAALHRLYKFTGNRGANFREGLLEFDSIHKAFHTALLAACGSPRLLDLHSRLYDQTYRYRVVMLGKIPRPSTLDGSHEQLAKLAVARKVDAACAKLRDHIAFTHRFAYGGEGAHKKPAAGKASKSRAREA